MRGIPVRISIYPVVKNLRLVTGRELVALLGGGGGITADTTSSEKQRWLNPLNLR
jgi:hypothetical protein